MFITVMYRDGKIGVVDAYQLDELISAKKIKKFMRSDGWVTIGSDPIRETDKNRKGQERRQRPEKRK